MVVARTLNKVSTLSLMRVCVIFYFFMSKFGAARSIETVRQAAGQWNTEHTPKKGKKRGVKKNKK